METHPLIVAIDGPAGAGKSAAARGLASRLGIPYLDTGAMYRAVALEALRAGVASVGSGEDERRVAEIAETVAISFVGDATGQRVVVNGRDVTGELRTPAVSEMASVVSAVSAVRRAMVQRQRGLAAVTGGVVEGRDIGTVVFPDAAVKIFLTASADVRARRRFDELRHRGIAVVWDDVLAEQRERDQRDSTRADSPLRPAPGAAVLDTSALGLVEVIERLIHLIRPGS